jgi:hypothetical protein
VGDVIDGSSAVLEEAAAVDGLPALVQGRACRVLSATSATPAEIARHAARLRGQGHAVVLAQTTIDAAIEAHGRNERIASAVRGLLSERPTISAEREPGHGRSYSPPVCWERPSAAYSSCRTPRLPP